MLCCHLHTPRLRLGGPGAARRRRRSLASRRRAVNMPPPEALTRSPTLAPPLPAPASSLALLLPHPPAVTFDESSVEDSHPNCRIAVLDVDKEWGARFGAGACDLSDPTAWPFAAPGKGIDGADALAPEAYQYSQEHWIAQVSGQRWFAAPGQDLQSGGQSGGQPQEQQRRSRVSLLLLLTPPLLPLPSPASVPAGHPQEPALHREHR